MDAEYTSTITLMNPVNASGAGIKRWNLNVPSYFYREIPTIFEAIGVILNAAVIIYFRKTKMYASPLFIILTSLATMDMCVCLGGLMHVFTVPEVITPEAGFMCGMVSFVSTLGIVGSEYHLIFFTSVRFYQVMSPLKAYVSVTAGLMMKWCIAISALSILGAACYAPYSSSLTTFIDGDEITMCIFLGDYNVRQTVFLFVITVIPCVSIFLIHVLKYSAYIRSKGLVETQQDRKSPDARVAAIVIALFYICWIPSFAYFIIQHMIIDDYANTRDNLSFVFLHLMYANSIVNPLVYVLAVKSIRKEAIKFFCYRKFKSSE